MEKKKVIVIGGGYAGLTAALRLVQKGHSVTLLEHASFLGGMAGTIPYQGERLEAFYHHWFTSDRAMLGLLDELGIGERLHRFESKMGFFCKERIWNFDSPMALLKFKPLSFFGRLRFGAGTLWLRDFARDWKQFEKKPAIEMMPFYVGKEATRVIWEPLLKGKFGPRYREVSMAWLWGKVKLRGSSRSKENSNKEELLYPEGSYEAVTQRIAEEIRRLGGVIHTGAPVERIRFKESDGVLTAKGVVTEKGELASDAVLHTAASHILCALAPDLPEDWREQVSSLEHAAAVCMILTLERSFSHIYWLNIGDTDYPFNAVIEQTNLVPKHLYNNRVPLYVSRYLSPDDPIYSMSEEELFEHYYPYLRRINPKFDRDWVSEVRVFRTRYAQPIVPCNYSSMIPGFQTPAKGLFMANLSQIYPEDRGTNYAVDLGNRVSGVVGEYLRECAVRG